MIEERVRKPCIGVVPYMPSLMLEEEDSLGLPATTQTRWILETSSNRPLRVAVIALPSFSNFTDFDSLRAETSVSLLFCRSEEIVAHADVVILPGTKQTVDDLLWMRELGSGCRTPAVCSYGPGGGDLRGDADTWRNNCRSSGNGARRLSPRP